jgi:hypothetical protein
VAQTREPMCVRCQDVFVGVLFYRIRWERNTCCLHHVLTDPSVLRNAPRLFQDPVRPPRPDKALRESCDVSPGLQEVAHLSGPALLAASACAVFGVCLMLVLGLQLGLWKFGLAQCLGASNWFYVRVVGSCSSFFCAFQKTRKLGTVV